MHCFRSLAAPKPIGIQLADSDVTKPSESSNLAARADSKVKAEERVTVARLVAGMWEEIALGLSADLFRTGEISVIKRDNSTALLQAVAMLEQWSNTFDSRATCRVLINALCKMGYRAQAVDAFGRDLVDFVHQQNV